MDSFANRRWLVANKQFALRGDQIKPLAENRGGCIATDMITVQGRKVGYMYREEPDNDIDSGWRFMAGRESRAYMDDATNHGVYDVNTVANYDPEIIPFLDAPTGSAFERQGQSGRFAQVEGEPWEPDTKAATSTAIWPPPGFLLVKGEHALTTTWSIHLPEQFARRVEEESLVLWRPGLTIWLTAWNNDHRESQARRLVWFKKSAAKNRFAEHEAKTHNTTRYSYRLHDENEDGQVESLYAFVMNDDGHLQLAVYFDKPADEAKARQLVDSIAERREN
jgi:hypothetical protein